MAISETNFPSQCTARRCDARLQKSVVGDEEWISGRQQIAAGNAIKRLGRAFIDRVIDFASTQHSVRSSLQSTEDAYQTSPPCSIRV